VNRPQQSMGSFLALTDPCYSNKFANCQGRIELRLFPASIDYREATVAPTARSWQHTFEGGVDQLADCPDSQNKTECEKPAFRLCD
jgi:hypothetical protein